MRGIATSVPFSVATGEVPFSPRTRTLSLLAWNSLQFEVLVTSR